MCCGSMFKHSSSRAANCSYLANSSTLSRRAQNGTFSTPSFGADRRRLMHYSIQNAHDWHRLHLDVLKKSRYMNNLAYHQARQSWSLARISNYVGYYQCILALDHGLSSNLERIVSCGESFLSGSVELLAGTNVALSASAQGEKVVLCWISNPVDKHLMRGKASGSLLAERRARVRNCMLQLSAGYCGCVGRNATSSSLRCTICRQRWSDITQWGYFYLILQNSNHHM